MATAVLLSACGHKAASSTTTTTRPTTTTAAGPPTPPALENTGDNFPSILNSIAVSETWQFAHPDQNIRASIYQPGSALDTQVQQSLAQLASDGQHLIGEPMKYENVKSLSQTPNNAVMRATLVSPARKIVDKQNRVIDSTELTRTLFDVFLAQDATGHWRLSDRQEVQTP